MASERVSAASMEKAAVAKSFLEQHMSSKMESIREQRERYRHTQNHAHTSRTQFLLPAMHVLCPLPGMLALA